MADAYGNILAHFGFAYASVAVISLLSERGEDLDALKCDSKMPHDVTGFCGHVAHYGSKSGIKDKGELMGVKATRKT